MISKINKKILILLLTFLVSALAFTVVACGGKPSDEGGKTDTVTVTLSSEELSISTYETPTLAVTITGAAGDPVVVWTSSDNTVATVENGKITPLKAGSTVIKAAVGNVFDECRVTVSAPIAVPAANVDYVTLYVYMGRNKQLEAYATYEGREVEGGTFTFTAEDPTVLSISSRGVAEGLKKGTTTVTVNGTLKGDALTSCTFDVEVFEDISVESNVAINTSIYRGAGRDSGNPFATTYTVAPTVKLNGSTLSGDISDKVDLELSTEDDDLIDLDGLTITGKYAGEAIVRLTATTPAGTSDYEDFIIVIEKPYATVNPASEIFIESKPGGLTADVHYLGLTDTIVMLEVNGERTTSYTYAQATDTFGVTTGIPYGKDSTVKFETESEIIYTTMTIAAVNIKTKEDMTFFVNSVAGWSDRGEKPYVIMSADIDYEGDLYNPGYVKWFNGYFDGQGHTFRNAVLTNGFFSRTGLGSTVKNIAIVDCSLASGTDNPAFIRDIHGTVQDVYFTCDITNMQKEYGHIASVPLTYSVETRSPDRAGTMKNVIAEFTGSTRSGNPAVTQYLEGPIENVYVLINEGGYNGNMWTYKQGKGQFKNVGVFTDEAEFKTATTGNDGFDTSASGVWKVNTEGKLVFKTA